jgi:prepilin-type N-terminal cleavage/methylation domain-containing protein
MAQLLKAIYSVQNVINCEVFHGMKPPGDSFGLQSRWEGSLASRTAGKWFGCAGYTLTEMVLALGMLSVLAVASAAAFGYATDRNALRGTKVSLQKAIERMRQEAVASGRSIGICPSDDFQSCGSNWARGWTKPLRGKMTASMKLASTFHNSC